MVVAEEMAKPTLKVSMSDSDSASEEESELSSDEGSISEDDVKSDASVNSSDDEKKDLLVTNEGWADSVSKILGSTKPKNKKTLVLSRAKKHSDIVKSDKVEKPSFEVIGDSSEKKPDIKEVPSKDGASEPPSKKVKVEKPSIRVKPQILEKDRERVLNKIATKGVVQLFNAENFFRNQQKTLERDLEQPDLTEGKKEKILKKFDKRTFLDTLMGNSKSVVVDEEAKTIKNELKHEEEKPKWNALRDDFMMGAKMKDWDKESVDE